MSEEKPNPFTQSAEQMRALGYKVVDQLIEHQLNIRNQAVVPPFPDTGKRQGVNLPEIPLQGRGADEALKIATHQVFANTMELTHPRFFAYVPGPAIFESAIADALAAGHNVFAGTSLHNEGAYHVEKDTIDWLCRLADYPESAGGLFTSGGSMATLTALYTAKSSHSDLDIANACVYVSSETHSCVERALSIIGFNTELIRTIRVSSTRTMRVDDLNQAIEQDLKAGMQPFCIVGTAGTTNTGAIDPLSSLADIAEQYGLWFHVDAAFGGPAMLSRDSRSLFAGIERANSLALDAHKWLFQAYECGICLLKDAQLLQQAYRRVPAYMRDPDAELPNYRDMGPQVTRAFKAFKLWFSLQIYGEEAFRKAVQSGIDLARYAQSQIEKKPDWEVTSNASVGIVSFRFTGADLSLEQLNSVNARIVRSMTNSGFAFLSSTELDGVYVIRLCPLHPDLQRSDIDETLATLARIATEDL